MTTVVDTSVLIDHLRGHEPARQAVRRALPEGLVASEITRLEVLVGMQPREEANTRALLAALAWYPLDERVAEEAGRLGRRWRPSHRGIDSADLAIAATAALLGAALLTRNVRHFPMFQGLAAPY